jgi:hypothetical protein
MFAACTRSRPVAYITYVGVACVRAAMYTGYMKTHRTGNASCIIIPLEYILSYGLVLLNGFTSGDVSA